MSLRRLFRKINKRTIVTLSLIVVVFVMSLGYAALSQYIEIDGVALIDRNWIINITNVSSKVTGTAINKSNPYVGSTVTMNATIPNASSTVTYTITLKNEGNLRAKLHSIEKIEDRNSSITYSISGVEEGVTTLDPGKTNTVTVTIKAKDGVTSISDIEKSVMLSFYYVENTVEHITGGNPSGGPVTYPEYSVGDYVMLVDGTRAFVVKDSNESEELITVITEESWGSFAFDTSGSVNYDPTSPTNVGYALNNAVLPQIKYNIDMAGGNSTGTQVRLLTYKEFSDNKNAYWSQVTASTTGSGSTMTMTKYSDTQIYAISLSSYWYPAATTSLPVRPVIITNKSNIAELPTTVLLNNTLQSDGTVSFALPSGISTSDATYGEHANASTNTSVSFTEATTYYFAQSYSFNAGTGTYTLAGSTVSSTWSAMSSNYKTYPYTCKGTSASATCTTLYRMTGYTSSTKGVGQSFSRVSISNNNGKGLYYTSTSASAGIDDDIYFRGSVTNNYVVFGKEEKTTCSYDGYEVCYFSYTTGTTFSSQCVVPTSSTNCSDKITCAVGGNYWAKYITVDDEATCTGLMLGTVVNGNATYGNALVNMYWRIVKFNDDGSTKLMYTGNAPGATGTSRDIGTSTFNSKTTDNAQMGYMYGNVPSTSHLMAHTNTNDSTIKEKLDSWYEDVLKENYSSVIAPGGFCNDRTVASAAGDWPTYVLYGGADTALGYGTNATQYGAFNRFFTLRQPQFSCTERKDFFTQKNDYAYGNQALDNPIGLITVDELVYAGAANYKGTENINNVTSGSCYLTSNSKYWTMSPSWYSSVVYGRNFALGSDNRISAIAAGETNNMSSLAVRPVISIKGISNLVSGKGTLEDPYVIEPEISLAKKILMDNNVQSDANIDFTVGSDSDRTIGLYVTSDLTETENGNPSYYYRGPVINNFMKFAGYYWRIMRINEDGSVRLIYNGTSPSATGSAATIGTYAFDSTDSTLNYGDSTIKNVLDSWYDSKLSSYSEYIADAGFCNDTSHGDSSIRIQNGNPQFKCSNENDLYTLIGNGKGNATLTKPIGIITADEAMYAGANWGTYNTNVYLGIDVSFNTMTSVYADSVYHENWYFADNNSLDLNSGDGNSGSSVTAANYTRPVINIKGDVIVKGNGTATNPYEIVE